MKLLLFDVDLTLVSTGGAGLRALDRAFEEILGIPGAIEGVRPHGKTDPAIVRDSVIIRRAALTRGIPYFTTAAGARAGVGAIRALQLESIGVRSLQEIHARARVPGVRVR